METHHSGTVVDKAISFVRDMFGIHPDRPDVEAKPEYSDEPLEMASPTTHEIEPRYSGRPRPNDPWATVPEATVETAGTSFIRDGWHH